MVISPLVLSISLSISLISPVMGGKEEKRGKGRREKEETWRIVNWGKKGKGRNNGKRTMFLGFESCIISEIEGISVFVVDSLVVVVIVVGVSICVSVRVSVRVVVVVVVIVIVMLCHVMSFYIMHIIVHLLVTLSL